VTRKAAFAFGILLSFSSSAFALNPALDVNQHAHTAWRIRDGFSTGNISSIAQTPDGYLWLATEFGLLRFDGIRAVPWQPSAAEQLPSDHIRSLLAARDGTLWVGTLKGLASWKDGKLALYPKLAEMSVDTLLEDQDGSIWAGGFAVPVGRLCAIRKDRTECYGEDGTLGTWVECLFEDTRRSIWAATAAGLWRWTPGPAKLYPMPSPIQGGPQTLIGGDRRSMLVATDAGIEEFADGSTEAYLLPGIGRQIRANKLFRDRNGALWIGSTRGGGLAHVHERKTHLFSKSNGLSGDTVLSFFEDREGSIRFRTSTVVTHSANEGLSNGSAGPILADRDGSVWISTTAALDRWKNGQITTYDGKDGKLNGDIPNALFQDSRGRVSAATSREFGYLDSIRFASLTDIPGGAVRGIVEDVGGNLWIANQSDGLIRLSPQGQVQVNRWDKFGRKDFAIALAADPLRGGVWLGFHNGGVFHFDGGEIRGSYTTGDGLGMGFVGHVRVDGDGTVWAATQGGLSRLKNGRVATLTSKNGLPCDSVGWSIQDNEHFFWLNMPCGLVRVERFDVDEWADAAEKDSHTTHRVQTTVFDSSDGLRAQGTVSGYAPPVTRSRDGKLWFTTSEGASVVDPSHLPFNRLPPPVHVEQITADHEIHDVAAAAIRTLPPLTRDL